MKRNVFLVLIALVAVVAVGCGTDSVLAPETNDAVMSDVSQPFVLDALSDTTITPADTTSPPASNPPGKKKKDDPKEPPKVEASTWGEIKARYR